MSERYKKWLKFLLVVVVLYCIFFQFRATIEQPIFNILLFIYNFVGDFGVSIIILTILVRLTLWPLVSRQFKQQKKMQAIQPKLAEIKKKANGNKMLEATMMQELYKENEIKPASSILTLVIQLPIFMAIFWIIRHLSDIFNTDANIAANAHDYVASTVYPFLQNLPGVSTIINSPENFSPHLFGIVDLTHIVTQDWDWVVLALAIAAAVFQYLQTRMTMPNQKNKRTLMSMFKEAAAGKDVSQAEVMQQSMGSMVKFFPIMTFLIAINFPGALVLYYATTSLLAIVQQKFILRNLPEELEATADGVGEISKIQEAEIIDAPKINKKTGTKIRRVTVEPKKKGVKK